MIILKHGNTLLHGKCERCGCEFLYSKREVETEYERINAYESEILYRYVKCPECNAQIKIDFFARDSCPISI